MTNATGAHPITVEVVRNSIVAFADEMANALCKAAYNMMIYEVRDFCCGLIDTQGRMISQNRGGLPIFLADLGVAVEDGIKRWHINPFAEAADIGEHPAFVGIGRCLQPAEEFIALRGRHGAVDMFRREGDHLLPLLFGE